MSILTSMTEIPDGELADHLGDVLRRAEAGEDVVVTRDGRPVVDLRSHPRSHGVEWDEFWAGPKADPQMLSDIKAIKAKTAPGEWRDPWERSEDRW